MRRFATGAILALLLIQPGIPMVSAQPLPGQNAALSGLDGVDVRILLSPDAAAAGLNAATLTQMIADRLQAAQIRFWGQGQSRPQGIAFLQVSVTTGHTAKGPVIFAVTTSVVEPVLLVRDPKKSIVAAIWQSSAIPGLAETNTAAFVTQEIQRQVDAFTHDYRAVNTAQ